MKLKLILLAAVASVLLVGPVSSASAASLESAKRVTGTGADGSRFNGTYKITSFRKQGNGIQAVGRLTGRARDKNGKLSRTFRKSNVPAPVSIPSSAIAQSAQAGGSCTILNLVLGPIDLNLLGLRIQTNTIRIRITGERGPGNLLGNLLCAITGLLNPGGSLLNLPPILVLPVQTPALP